MTKLQQTSCHGCELCLMNRSNPYALVTNSSIFYVAYGILVFNFVILMFIKVRAVEILLWVQNSVQPQSVLGESHSWNHKIDYFGPIESHTFLPFGFEGVTLWFSKPHASSLQHFLVILLSAHETYCWDWLGYFTTFWNKIHLYPIGILLTRHHSSLPPTLLLLSCSIFFPASACRYFFLFFPIFVGDETADIGGGGIQQRRPWRHEFASERRGKWQVVTDLTCRIRWPELRIRMRYHGDMAPKNFFGPLWRLSGLR